MRKDLPLVGSGDNDGGMLSRIKKLAVDVSGC